MNLGVDPAFVLDREGRGKWDAHGEAVWEAISRDSTAYLDRLSAIASQALSLKADAIVFPACTFWHTRELPLKAFLSAMPRGLTVFAGTNGTHGDELSGEGVVVYRDGETLERHIGGVRYFGLKGLAFMTAVSSTIALARDKVDQIVESSEHPPKDGAPVILVDMGHHQYTGRYMLTLRSVAKAVSRRIGVPAVALLSYWKYRWTDPWSSWVTKNDWEWRAKRHRVGIDGGDMVDLIDLVELDL
jgi:hypothetical protein